VSLAPRLDLRQSQQLVMTPQLQQAIRLLQLNNLELQSAIEAEMEANPLLEFAVAEPDEGGDVAPEPAGETDSFSEPDPATADELIADGNGAADAPIEADYWSNTEAAEPESAASSAAAAREPPGVGDIDALAEMRTTLADHLEAQAAAQLSGINLAIARYLIDLIDEAGYLRGDVPEVAAALGVQPLRVERILKLIQRFDPVGAGARTVAECLMVQAEDAGALTPPLRQLIRNLDLLARGELVSLRRICRVTADELNGLIRRLRQFNPRPGAGFGPVEARPVTPDVFVVRTARGWSVELNDATCPRVLVNRSYHAELARSAHGSARQFLTDCLQNASWLTKALDQRARTIVRVVSEIVRLQEGFFEAGISRLRPLTLRAVADSVGMHESTISRVTSGKYLSCERGVFELKYFFTPALSASDGGEQVSTEAVKSRLKSLIDGEKPDAILSDDKLVEVLRAEGFDVARRTVAKYREGLGIGSSVERRRRVALAG